MCKQKEKIVKFLNEFWNCKSTENKSHLYSIFSKDLLINSPLGKTVGLPKLLEVNDAWYNAFPNIIVDKIDVESFGNVIVTNWWGNSRHENSFKELAATGKKICYPGETIFFFNELGQISRYSCKIDMLNIYKQLGVVYHNEEYSEQALLKNDKDLLIQTLKKYTKELLTSREIQSLSLNLLGFSAKQIGLFLYISPRTVETHLQRALHSLGCSTRLQCLEVMVENSLLPIWQDLGKILVREYESRKKSLPISKHR
ncbi:MAG: ester cyclase [Simkania sp.]|nr:ester cyclase [Simkania sp.]